MSTRKYPNDFINKIICGDCLKVMKEMPETSVDAIVTDPPYGLEFMGKEWDKLDSVIKSRSQWWEGKFEGTGFKKLPQHTGSKNFKCKKCGHYKYSGTPCKCDSPDWEYSTIKKQQEMQLWHTQWLTEAYRVLKPGGSMLVMGGTRTFHRLMCAIEDSGFIIKDTLMWLYGSGFPKAQDLGKMIDKRMGKEREVIGDNPHHRSLKETNTMCGEPHTGDGKITAPSTDLAKHWDGFKVGGIKPAYEPIIWAVKPPEGSYVDNVLKWGVGAVNVDECRIGFNGQVSHSKRKSDGNPNHENPSGWKEVNRTSNRPRTPTSKGRFPANVILDEEAGKMLDEQSGDLQSGDNPKRRGSAVFKSCYGEFQGQENCLNYYSRGADSGGASRFFYCAKASRSERGKDNKHPTVKPIALFMWLIQLITREEQLILDPFIGSGTTMLASQGCNRKCVGIEKDKDYCKIAEERLAQGVL